MPSDALELKIQLVPSLDGLEVEGVTSPVGPLTYVRDQVAKRRIRIQKNGKDGDWTGATLASAVGKPDQDPTSGTYTVTFGADTTAALDWDTTAAELSTALNAEASITAAGGVVVEAVGTLFKISFLVNGARALLVVTGTFLQPPTTPRVIRNTVGDGSTKEVQLFSLSQTMFAFSDNWTLHQGGTATPTQDFAGDFSAPARYTIEFDPAPTGGVLVATCAVQEVTLVVFSGVNGGDADGCWFTLCDQFGVVGFWFSDGTTTEPPSELTSITTRQLQKITVLTGDNTSQVNDAIETILLFYADSFLVTSTPSDVPIVVENVESGERTTPQVDSTGLMAATVQALGFSATAAIKIGSNASEIENALGGDFTVTVGEDNYLTLIATSNRALPNFTLDHTGVNYPDYFEGSMDFQQLPLEWAFEGISQNIIYLDCYTEFSLTRASSEPDTVLFFPSVVNRNLIRSGASYNPGSISGDPVTTGNTLWVDEIYGTAAGVVNRFDRPYSSIQSAMDAVTAGDLIFIRSGTYSEDFQLVSGVKVKGASRDTVLLTGSITDDDGDATGVVFEDCTISSLALNGSASSISARNCVITGATATAGNTFNIDNCEVDAATLHGTSTIEKSHFADTLQLATTSVLIGRFCVFADATTSLNSASSVATKLMGCFMRTALVNVTNDVAGGHIVDADVR